jgi:hypothetical protein
MRTLINAKLSGWDTHEVSGWNSAESLWDGFSNGAPIDPYNANLPNTLSWDKGWLHVSHDRGGYPSRWWKDGMKEIDRKTLATNISAELIDDTIDISLFYKVIEYASDPFPPR